ncbi:MAG: subclass B3 metallo-beta-lactamase [Kofleriaceae bacterium]
MRMAVVLAVVACGGGRSPSVAELAHGAWSAPIEPFRIVGNLYYVGAQNIASYLVATRDGLILVDTGSPEMIPVVRANIEKLGFHVQDVKILLSGHAHWDHVGGHAAMQRASGAQVMALGDDAVALERGTDLSPSASDGWEPVHVDRVLHDGDTVELGGTTLQAIWAPGHTPGCTVWTGQVSEDARSYRIAFFACMEPGGDVKLVDRPALVEQTRATFRKLRGLAPDFALLVHPAEQLEGKLAQLHAGTRPSPLYDPRAWGRFLDESERDLEQRATGSAKAR